MFMLPFDVINNNNNNIRQITMFLVTYKVMCVHTCQVKWIVLTHTVHTLTYLLIYCSALIAAAICQIWWKSVNKFQSYSKIKLLLYFVGHGVHSPKL